MSREFLINIHDFDEYQDPVIVERGKEYATEDRVISLHSTAKGMYSAVVRGNEDYEVFVELDDEGNILDSDCDCPYDFGPVCKHQAAVFFKLRNRSAYGTYSHEEPLRQLLEAEPKETLVDLLLSLASESYTVEEQIRLHLSSRDENPEPDACRRLIRSYIDAYSDGDGFVPRRNVGRALEGAEIAAEKAHAAIHKGEWFR